MYKLRSYEQNLFMSISALVLSLPHYNRIVTKQISGIKSVLYHQDRLHVEPLIPVLKVCFDRMWRR